MGKIEKGEELTEQVNRAVAELQEQLAQGHTQHYLDTLVFFSRFHRYSWGNSLLISRQYPLATVVAGYRRWEELGFQVRKGETGIAIRAPWLRKEVDPDTGEKTERLIGYIPAYVFDISQTVDYPDKQPPSLFQDVPGDYTTLYQHLWSRVEARIKKLVEEPLVLAIHGYHYRGQIVINSQMSVYLKATCLIHEYVHAVAHPTEAERECWTRDEREWQAESVTFVVCQAIGLECPNSRDYLLGYHLTTDKLADMLKLIQGLTKRVMADLDLLQPIIEETAAIAAD